MPSIPWASTPNGFIPGASSSLSVLEAYAMPPTDGRNHGNVVTGTILVDSFESHAFFDFGASFSFVSEGFVVHADLVMYKISVSIMVSSARGLISSCSVCPGCSIFLANEIFVANLVLITLEPFNVILVMDWISQYWAIISCFWKTVSLKAPSRREVIF